MTQPQREEAWEQYGMNAKDVEGDAIVFPRNVVAILLSTERQKHHEELAERDTDWMQASKKAEHAIDSDWKQRLKRLTKAHQEEIKRKVGEAKARVELDKAEAQLQGYVHHKTGGGIKSLIWAMGLTRKEWQILQREYGLPYLKQEDIKDIDDVISENSKQETK